MARQSEIAYYSNHSFSAELVDLFLDDCEQDSATLISSSLVSKNGPSPHAATFSRISPSRLVAVSDGLVISSTRHTRPLPPSSSRYPLSRRERNVARTESKDSSFDCSQSWGSYRSIPSHLNSKNRMDTCLGKIPSLRKRVA